MPKTKGACGVSGDGGGKAISKSRATVIGTVAILLWAALALLTVRAGGMPPFQLLALSFGVAFVSGAVVLTLRGRAAWRELTRAPPGAWLLSFCGLFGYHAMYYYALSAAPPAEASLVAYLWPLLIVLFSAMLPGEGLRPRHVLGACLGLAGTAIIAMQRGAGAAGPAIPLAGFAAALACALIWAGYSVLNRRYRDAPSSMMVGVCGLVALAGAASHALFETSVPVHAGQWLAIVLLGLGPTGLAFLAWDYATKHGNLALLGALSYLAPLLSTAALVAAGDTQARLTLLVAAVAIILGSVIATGAWRRGASRAA
jgi:drug/metabolite transporter (DMT)-like permease